MFEQACRGVHRFQYRGVPIASWLYRVAHNVMVDWQRKRRRTPEVPVLVDIPGADQTDRVDARDELMPGVEYAHTGAAAGASAPSHRRALAASAGAIIGKKENAIRARA